MKPDIKKPKYEDLFPGEKKGFDFEAYLRKIKRKRELKQTGKDIR